MKAAEQYDSLVINRMNELQAELERTQEPLQQEFLNAKINYLKKLTDLPLYMAISTMSLEDIQIIKEKYGFSEQEAQTFLIRLFGLENVERIVKQPKTVTLEYLKNIMLSDFSFMSTLLELQRKNFDYESKKQALWGTGLDGTTSYLQLSYDEKNLNVFEAKLETAIKDVNANYDLVTLKEVRNYYKNPNRSLTKEFILKHSDQIIKKNPEMAKTVKQLTQTGIRGTLSRISPFRKKREQEVLNTIMDCYKSNHSLTTLGITEQNILEMNETQVRSLLKRIKKQTNQKRNKVNEQRSRINEARKVTLNTIKQYDVLQASAKEKFITLLSSRTNFFPRMFKDQIWNEPELQESLMRVACYQEEKTLMEALANPAQNQTQLLLQTAQEKPKQYVKAA